jgi:hypothetical protein
MVSPTMSTKAVTKSTKSRAMSSFTFLRESRVARTAPVRAA